MRLAETIDFPNNFPEEERLKLIKMLQQKDKQVLSLEGKIEVYESLYNGGLTYSETRELKSELQLKEYALESIKSELEKVNIKVQKNYTDSGSMPYEYKLIKKSFLTKIKQFFK